MENKRNTCMDFKAPDIGCGLVYVPKSTEPPTPESLYEHLKQPLKPFGYSDKLDDFTRQQTIDYLNSIKPTEVEFMRKYTPDKIITEEYNPNYISGDFANGKDQYDEQVFRIMFVDDDNNIIHAENTNRLDSLPWYKKLWAKINRRYRDKYVDLRGFKVDYHKKAFD